MNWKPPINPRPAGPNFEQFFNNFLGNSGGFWKLLVLFLIFVGLMSSFYTVQPEEEAVVLRLGRYLDTTSPGLHFKIPFGIDKVTKLKTGAVLQESFGFFSEGASERSRYPRDMTDESHMLTGDLNVADVEWVVQYQIADPQQFLFNVKDPRTNIRDISQAVMRRVVGDRTVSDVLTVGREKIAAESQGLVQSILDEYRMGVKIVSVKLQDVNPPEPVKPSFNEVNAAKQEQEQAINRAEAYYNKMIPEARGKAEQEISQSKGYAAALINRSQGDAENFSKIASEYRKSSEITRTRLYLETMEEIMKNMNGLTIVDPNIKGVMPLFADKGSVSFDAKARPQLQGGQ